MPQSFLRVALWASLTTLLCSVACGGGKGGSKPPPTAVDGWWNDRVVYEVFVRSFADSDGDGIGDLPGLTAQLDALNDGDPATTTDLGVGALWLMPVFASPSYHGYDVTDYRAIEPDYGTLADFDAFVQAAHDRGIKVVLDYVVNHTSREHEWFVDSAAGGPKRDWYSWRATNPGWTRPWDGGGPTWHLRNGSYYYGLFWAGMPDLNFLAPAVEDQVVADMRYWLARGVDGFRLDAVRYLVETDAGQADLAETHALLRRLRARLTVEYPDVLLVGEAWTSIQTVATYYGEADELHLAFNFELAEGIKASLQGGDRGAMRTALSLTNSSLASRDRRFDAPFLSNHDMPRTMRRLGGSAGAARAAAATLLALPGTPFVYYGEELGMQGGESGDDRDKRTPYRWTPDPGHGFTDGTPWYDWPEAAGTDLAGQRGVAGSLWTLYRDLIALRTDTPALAEGRAELPDLTGGGGGAFALVRILDDERVLFVTNVGASPSGAFTVNVPGDPTVLLSEGLIGTPQPSGGSLSVGGLDGRGFAFIALH